MLDFSFNSVFIDNLVAVEVNLGARGQSVPRCHQVGKFLAKAVDQKLITCFLNKKTIFARFSIYVLTFFF